MAQRRVQSRLAKNPCRSAAAPRPGCERGHRADPGRRGRHHSGDVYRHKSWRGATARRSLDRHHLADEDQGTAQSESRRRPRRDHPAHGRAVKKAGYDQTAVIQVSAPARFRDLLRHAVGRSLRRGSPGRAGYVNPDDPTRFRTTITKTSRS